MAPSQNWRVAYDGSQRQAGIEGICVQAFSSAECEEQFCGRFGGARDQGTFFLQ